MYDGEVIYRELNSPIGQLRLVGDGEILIGLYMETHVRGPEPQAAWRRDQRAFPAVAAQLAAYFSGERVAFDVPLALAGTPFQRRVWQALGEIEFGQTSSYAAIARQVGAPRAVRAVGAAIGRNPVSIIVPCHRVLGSNGGLTGFAGGLARKRWLLEHEGVLVAEVTGRVRSSTAVLV